ncbi:hypothetical protein Droror1_Dr00027384 [Drosera rotundifolia]
MESTLMINLHHHHLLDHPDSLDLSNSPSFSSYASNSLAATASRVVADFDFDFEIPNHIIASEQPPASVYPFFGRDSFSEKENHRSRLSASESRCSTLSSSSSSEGKKELEGISAESYCLWTPNNRCAKRNSIGSTASRLSSLRFRDSEILKRSKSVGGERSSGTKTKIPAAPTMASVGRSGYGGRSREAEKRKSYLPYRQNLVSLFPSFQGLRAVTFGNF